MALEPSLRLIVDRVCSLLQADAACLALRDSDVDRFVVQAHSGMAHDLFAGGQVVVTGAPMLVGNCLENNVDSPFLGLARKAGLRAYVSVPLKAHATIIGILFVGSGTPHKFREDDQRLLSALGDLAAVAIENAKLYQQVREYAGELERKVELRTREVQEANRRLEAASRHKSPFLANMGHELRTPLNAIIGFSELLLDDSAKVSPEEQREFLGDILSNARHLLRLINDILEPLPSDAPPHHSFPSEHT